MDAELIREWLSTIGALSIGAGTLWLAYTGQAFRSDKHFENKFDLAKEAIRIFNHLRNDLQQIRSPLGYEGEHNQLKNLPEDNELIKKMKKSTSGGITLLRMNNRSESLAEMNRLEPEFKAVFGDTKAFQTMRSKRHEIWVAATMMVDGESGKENRQVIYSMGKDDKIDTSINSAVEEIENLCKPILSGKKK